VEVEVQLAVEGDLSFLPPHQRGDFVCVRVRDNGHGMSESTRARIFEPFFTTRPPGHGTGLGLSVAYAIVEEHHGHLTCTSAPERGTVFSVFLPAVVHSADDPPPRSL
jgi:signal transduction histidine kinase